MNTIEWKNKARKQLKKLPAGYQRLIVEAVDTLGQPKDQWKNVKELKNHDYGFRMRVGRYRVLFDFEGTIQVIEIQEVREKEMSAFTKQIEHQVIMLDGKPAFAVVPFDQFEKMAEQYTPDESNVSFPHQVVKANVNGDSLVKAWREYLGLTQKKLADRLGISQPAMAKMERPDANLRKSTLKKIADAMGLSVEHLEE